MRAAPRLESALAEARRGGAEVVVDLDKVDFMDCVGLRALAPKGGVDEEIMRARLKVALAKRYYADAAAPTQLDSAVPVSIVVATRDRPNQLRQCLCALLAQLTCRFQANTFVCAADQRQFVANACSPGRATRR